MMVGFYFIISVVVSVFLIMSALGFFIDDNNYAASVLCVLILFGLWAPMLYDGCIEAKWNRVNQLQVYDAGDIQVFYDGEKVYNFLTEFGHKYNSDTMILVKEKSLPYWSLWIYVESSERYRVEGPKV